VAASLGILSALGVSLTARGPLQAAVDHPATGRRHAKVQPQRTLGAVKPPSLARPLPPPAALREPGVLGAAGVPVLRFGWPIQPFHRQHSIRATFGEPRGFSGLGLSVHRGTERARTLNSVNQVAPSGVRFLHTGVDIVAADGTPVYAVTSGVARIGGRGYDQYVMVGGFGYWHLADRVLSGARVRAFRTVIGRVYPGQGHVHLTRFIHGWEPANPLVAGGLTPYQDRGRPTIGALSVYATDGQTVDPHALAGRVALVVPAFGRENRGGLHTGVYRMGYALTPWRADRPVVGPYEVFRFDVLPPTPVGAFLYTVGSTRHDIITRFAYRLTARSPSGDGLLDTSRLRPGRYRLSVWAADDDGDVTRRTFHVAVAPGAQAARPTRPQGTGSRG